MRIALSIMLLAEVVISRYLTGTALHVILVLGAALLFGILRWFGPQTARTAGFGCAAGLAIGGWYLFMSNIVPVALSELPGVFHASLGIHFFLWSLAVGSRRGKNAVVPAQLDPVWLVAGLLAGIAVAWTTGTLPIYVGSEWLIRALGFGVLAGAIFLACQRKPGLGAVAQASVEGRWRSVGLVALLTLAAISLAAASVPLAERAAGRLYGWFGMDDNTTSLGEFGARRPIMKSGSGDLSQAGRELPKKADIELDPSVRFYVEAEDESSFEKLTRREVYTRTSTLSIFADDGVLAPLRTGEWRFDSDDGAEDGRVNLSPAVPESDSVTYSVLIESRDSRALPLVAPARSVALDSIFSYADGWYQLALDEHQERVRFRATTSPGSVSDLLASGTPIQAGTAPDDYLRLPVSPLTGQVREVASQLAADHGSGLENLLPAVRGWIGARCDYSLSYQNPDELTPVENFLFGERKGHCELFAAGTVMLLRSLGIPSRVAYGYCGGVADHGKRILAFRESDFHAWAEIYLQDRGWVSFETTPAGQGAVHQPRNQTGSPAFSDANLAGYEMLGDFGPIEVVETGGFSVWMRKITAFAFDWFLVICAVLVGIGAAVFWFRQRSTAPRGRGATRLSTPGGSRSNRTPEFVTEYLQACRNIGFEKRPGQTWSEFLQALKNAGVCRGEFDELNRYLYRIKYAGQARDDSREQDFRDWVRAFAETHR